MVFSIIIPVSETIKNVIEFVNSVYNASEKFENIFFIKIIGKVFVDWFVYIITFQWINDFSKIPVILPSAAESLFLNNPTPEMSFIPVEPSTPLFPGPFISGFFSSFFLYIPLSSVHFIWLRYVLIDGLNAIWMLRAATLAIILGNLSLLACCLFGCTSIINFWFGLEPWSYFFGVWLVFKMGIKLVTQRYFVRLKYEKFEIWTIFFAIFFCVWTDQSGLYQFLGNLSIQSGFSILDFANSSINIYFLGIVIGSFIWPFLISKTISQIMNLVSKLPMINFSQVVRGMSKSLVVASIALSVSSFPFYESGYLFSRPFGFVPQDQALELVSLTSKTPDTEQGRLGEKSNYTSVDTDLSSFDRGRYAGGPGAEIHIESLNYREEYAWRSRIDRFSSRGLGSLNRRKSFFNRFLRRHLGPTEQALQNQRKQRKRVQQIRKLKNTIIRDRIEQKKRQLKLFEQNQFYMSDDSSSSDLEDLEDLDAENEERLNFFYGRPQTKVLKAKDFEFNSLDDIKGISDYSSESDSDSESDYGSDQNSDNESDSESDYGSDQNSDQNSDNASGYKLDLEPAMMSLELPSDLPSLEDLKEYYNLLIERFIENYTAEANMNDSEIPNLSKNKMIRFSAFSEVAKLGFDSFSFANTVEIDPHEKEISRDLKERFSENIFNKLLLRFNVSSFLKRQPTAHKLTPEEEIYLFKNRLALGEYFNTLRTYFDLPSVFQPLFVGPKSYTNRIYNQQFKGTLKIVERLFSIHLEKKENIPPLPISSETKNDEDKRKEEYDQFFNSMKKTSKKNELLFAPLKSRLIEENVKRLDDQYLKLKNKQKEKSVIKFDQPLYKDKFLKQNPLLHEELIGQIPYLTDDTSVEPFLENVSSFPFFVGWDSEERKFVVTNRILNRKEILKKTSLPRFFKFRKRFLAQKEKTKKYKMFIIDEEKDVFLFSTWPVKEKYLKKNKFFSRLFSLSDELSDAAEDVFQYPEPGEENEFITYTKLPTTIRRLGVELKDQPYLGVKRGGFVWPGSKPLKYKLPSFNFPINKLFKGWKFF